MVVFNRRPGRSPKLCAIFAFTLLAGLPPTPLTAASPEVVVGAAANLTAVFQALGPRFQAETGIHPIFSYGSTAQIARQIENGAPIDVFAAADSEHVDALEAKRLLVPGSRAIYAEGVLALWIPPDAPNGVANGVKGIENLTLPEVRIIAVANPSLAPYGEAAAEALKRAGVWDRVKAKIVYAENINMARQYGTSGNADAVFTAYALVMREQGSVLKVAPALYTPIRQSLGIVEGSANQAAARRFVDFLLRGNGRALLKDYGYGLPGPATQSELGRTN